MRFRSNGTRVALSVTIALVLLGPGEAVVAPPAFAADCQGEGSVRDRGGDVTGECQEESAGQPGSTSVEEVWRAYCSLKVGAYQPGDTVEYERSEPATEGDIEYHGLDPSGEHWWWFIHCVRDGVPVHGVEILVTESPGVPPEVIRDRASARIDPPVPSPVSSPPLGEATYVAIPTWLWLDRSEWTPIEVSETQGLITVVVRATPVEAAWEMGDGERVSCDGPGVEWLPGLAEDATDCSYTYTTSSYGAPNGVFSGSVTVTWVFEWWINSSPEGSFGTVDLSSDFEVAVAEIQAVETEG